MFFDIVTIKHRNKIFLRFFLRMRGLNWIKDAEKSFGNTHRREVKCTIKTKLDTNEILVQKLFAKTYKNL